MIHEVKGRSLLDGCRGQPAVDRDKLIQTLKAVGRLMLERDEVSELDLNPIRVYPDALLALDARIMIQSV